MADSQIIRHINENADSIEIGNAKSGTVKIYCDGNNIVEAEAKLDNLIKLLLRKRKEVLGD